MLPIVFVDTNIILDAYRSRNDIGLHLFQRLHEVQDHLITTYQVEMEFKKNRQAAILESLKSLKEPSEVIQLPAFLSQTKTVEMVKRNSDNTKTRIRALRKRIGKILANPARHHLCTQSRSAYFRRHRHSTFLELIVGSI